MLHPELDVAYQIGFWACVIIVPILCIIAGILAGILFGGKLGAFLGLGVGIVISAIVFGVWAWAVWPPFDSAYHTYQPVTVTVQDIGSRFIDSGNNSTSQRFAVEGTNGQTYGVDDTRASVLQKGDVVTLLCELQWEANGVPGEVCNWGHLGSNN